MNSQRGATGVLTGAINAAKTHCKHGHEFTPENTNIYTHRGYIERECRACKARRSKKK